MYQAKEAGRNQINFYKSAVVCSPVSISYMVLL